jgi:hypothetical protein
VIIGNPPYVEYKEVRDLYKVEGYETEKCADLYAFVIERSFKLMVNNGYFGMIVPVSLVGTDGFKPLRDFLKRESTENWLSTYAMRPSKLFNGAEKHLCISLALKAKTGSNSTFCTKYHRWLNEERDVLFKRLHYVQTPSETFYLDAIPKVGTRLEITILKKLLADVKTIGTQESERGKNSLYHTRKLRYFLQFLDRAPRILEHRGKERITSELKELRFDAAIDRDVALGAYCSTLFFYYYLLFSDCRNVNKREVTAFTLDIGKLNDPTRNALSYLTRKLMQDLQDNSEMRTMHYAKYGTLEVQVFSPRLSKPIIDEIDLVLAKHYGFTEEETDFIINYDIKYRMGSDGEDE